ncbi:DUF3301 domain-containing protein [Alterluteimonas muca]|uniref:DUF3301 domain-containing protein n=1 Tax=Alterluteimonas muca TaxID=2878684 RepID=UPI003F4A516A
MRGSLAGVRGGRHISGMSDAIFVMILGAAAFAWWSAARAAAERAESIGREACRLAGVQWLDQTVHASGLRLRRRDDGRLGFERSFRFEYSDDGVERSVGRLVLRGDELVAFVGPVGGEQVVQALR